MTIDLNNYLHRTIKLKYQKLPKNLFELTWSADYRKWMRTYFPGASVEQHVALRNAARIMVEKQKADWGKVADLEFQRVFNRKMEVRDYRVSCIARSEFSEPVKEALRKICFSENLYSEIARGHNLMLPARLRN